MTLGLSTFGRGEGPNAVWINTKHIVSSEIASGRQEVLNIKDGVWPLPTVHFLLSRSGTTDFIRAETLGGREKQTEDEASQGMKVKRWKVIDPSLLFWLNFSLVFSSSLPSRRLSLLSPG